MKTVKLPAGIYEYDPSKPLGRRGGFGQVFVGRSLRGNEIAVKKLHLSAADAAHRELRIADELKDRIFEHVVPFIDAGEDADTGDYFVVMPKAEGNLQNKVAKNGSLSPKEAASVLLQITKGLIEVGNLVHRDLKPDNVLLHEGKWKIADFGIARFVEDATASDTLKGFLSDWYAAPEQWRLERSTHATDVYALGCIAFCLLTGMPPFTKDPQAEHQNAAVPPFSCSERRLTALVQMCLRKVASSRPSLSRVRDLLADIVAKPSAGNPSTPAALLEEAGAEVAESQQRAQADDQRMEQESSDRIELARAAYVILSQNVELLWSKIQKHAPAATRANSNSENALDVRLGNANLTFSFEVSRRPLEFGDFSMSGWDVIAMASFQVTQKGQYSLDSTWWGSSLWFGYLKRRIDLYGNPVSGIEHRWREVGYHLGFMNGGKHDPVSAARTIDDADRAGSGMGHHVHIAYGPWDIDDEAESDFHERCIWLLAAAAKGRLPNPAKFPITSWPPPLTPS